MRGWRRFLTFIVAIVLAIAALYFLRPRGRDEGVSVTFLGGAREVGGSCILVSGGGVSFLVDCGDNPCGDMAIEESCACELCGEGSICEVTGREVSCNSCPSGLCP